jgi:hypothetical protein
MMLKVTEIAEGETVTAAYINGNDSDRGVIQFTLLPTDLRYLKE